jgi:hypothetical protein
MIRELWNRIRQLAGNACEYCRMPADHDPLPFQIDHVIARQHGGRSVFSNLVWSCLHCNKHKGPNIAGYDVETDLTTPLFHPRRQQWRRHFAWQGAMLIGRTRIGRVTIHVLAINDPDFVAFRAELLEEGVFHREWLEN